MIEPLSLPYFKLLFTSIVLSLFSAMSTAADAVPTTRSVTTQASWHWYDHVSMTTKIALQLFHNNADEADGIAAKVFAEFDTIESAMSSYQERSELSHLNRSAYCQPVQISPALYEVIDQAQRISTLTNGAFDISFSSLGYLYNFRTRKQPNEGQRAKLAPVIDFNSIILNPTERSVQFSDARLRLDLGGIAKGYAVDRGISILKSYGVTSARLSAGGDMYLLGDKRGKPWLVGVKDPRKLDQEAVVLPLSEVAVSTSGDYERYFIDDDGERVHHIISPNSGKPAKGVQSVTVIGPRTIETDALSTAVFVLGVEDGLALINALNDIDVVIVDDQRQLHYSNGLLAPSKDVAH